MERVIISLLLIVLMISFVSSAFGLNTGTQGNYGFNKNNETSTTTIISGGGNITTFLDLLDTPNSYTGEGTNCVIVNAGETALEFGSCGAGGGGGNTTEEIQDAVGSGFTGNLSYDDAGNKFDINSGNLLSWLDNIYARITNLVGLVGNWSLDKPNYANYSNISGTFAKYNFTTNNFNGTGNFTTTGYGTFSWIDKLAQDNPPETPPLYTLRLWVDYDAVSGFSTYRYKDDTTMVRRIADNVFIGKNTGGTQINKGSVVYSCGSSGLGAYPLLCLAKADNISTMPSIGVAIENITNGGYGRVMAVGVLENVNTNSFNSNAPLYVSDTVAGSLIMTKPLTPNLTQEIGTVLVKSATAGKIELIARSLTGAEFGTINNFTAVGNITAPYFIGSGAFLTSVNYTETDSKAYNGTLAYNSSLSNYRTLNNNSFTNGMNITSGSLNITSGNLSLTGRINLGISDCTTLVSGDICRNATGMYSKG